MRDNDWPSLCTLCYLNSCRRLIHCTQITKKYENKENEDKIETI